MKKANFEIKTLFRGEYRCVLNEGTDREVDTGWFKNLITDIGLDRLGALAPSVALFQWASIGTGTTAPVNSNTSLQAWVASVSVPVFDSNSNGGPSAYTAQCQFHHVYAQGAVVGNMAEVGVGWATGGGSLWSRALILDGGGSPTTLTVTSLDQLTVYYKLTCTPAIADLTGTVVYSGVTYNYTGRLANAATFCQSLFTTIQSSGAPWGTATGSTGFPMASYSTQTLGAITSTPAGTGTNGGSSVSVGSYTAGNKYLDNTIVVNPSSLNSAGGIGSFVVHFCLSQMEFQYSLANVTGGTPLPKDNTKTWTLTVRFAWDRV